MTHLAVASPRGRFVDVLVEGVRSRLEEAGEPPAEALGEDTRLVGERAVIGSLALVSLIVELEQTVEDEFGIAVTLADERALSQTKSPFRTVGTLADYTARLLAEQASA
jgi:acyl carrier protein